LTSKRLKHQPTHWEELQHIRPAAGGVGSHKAAAAAAAAAAAEDTAVPVCG
jgi:hypothetical protein